MLIQSVVLPRDTHTLDGVVHLTRRSSVWILTARRNAWHSVLTNYYQSNEAIFTSPASARLYAEDRRKRGTFFEIEELPALVFDMEKFSLVVVHLNETPPFKRWAWPTSFSQSTLKGIDILRGFSSRYYRQFPSGWAREEGDPAVITGLVDFRMLATASGQHDYWLERSSVEPDGWMTFHRVRSRRITITHLERITEELNAALQERSHGDRPTP